MTGRLCSVLGCGRPMMAKDFCALHYQRWRKHGDPGPVDPGDRVVDFPPEVKLRYPSTQDQVGALTDPDGPAFWQLAALIPAGLRARARARAEARWEREKAEAASAAAVEISWMSTDEVEALMQPDIPAPAWTRRAERARKVA